MNDSGTMRPGKRLADRLARLRVPLGFVFGVLCIIGARPTPMSTAAGLTIAALGEALRVWAAGHIEKGREITRSGPYSLMRHPLYLGSTIMAVGFVVAARSGAVAVAVAIYLAATMTAAVRTEEAVLDRRFAGEYSAYREGRTATVHRSFSLARAFANREHRAVIGFFIVGALLYARMLWP